MQILTITLRAALPDAANAADIVAGVYAEFCTLGDVNADLELMYETTHQWVVRRVLHPDVDKTQADEEELSRQLDLWMIRAEAEVQQSTERDTPRSTR